MTCAFAVRGALRKVQGVESVDVSLNKGAATVKLKLGNTVTPQQLWDLVRRNGFTPKQTHVAVHGTLSVSPPQLKVTGTGQVLTLKGGPRGPGNGATVTLKGTLTPGSTILELDKE